MPYFEEKYPQDNRPRQAIETLKTWIDTGVFKMAVIRKASLDSHAAAREVGEDSPARSAARAAGQCVAIDFFDPALVGDAVQMFSLAGLSTYEEPSPATTIASHIPRTGAKVVLLDGFQGAELLLPAQSTLREVLAALAIQVRCAEGTPIWTRPASCPALGMTP